MVKPMMWFFSLPVRTGKFIDFHLWRWTLKLFYKPCFRSFGKNAYLHHPVKFEGTQYITLGANVIVLGQSWLAALALVEPIKPSLEIGNGTYIGRCCHIVAVSSVRIGIKVLIADRVYISDNSHDYSNPKVPIMDQPVLFKGAVEIGDGSWIGENVSVIGAKIGRNCVIGANSVVTRDIPDFSVAVGSPAQVIKSYDMMSGTWKKVGQL